MKSVPFAQLSMRTEMEDEADRRRRAAMPELQINRAATASGCIADDELGYQDSDEDYWQRDDESEDPELMHPLDWADVRDTDNKVRQPGTGDLQHIHTFTKDSTVL